MKRILTFLLIVTMLTAFFMQAYAVEGENKPPIQEAPAGKSSAEEPSEEPPAEELPVEEPQEVEPSDPEPPAQDDPQPAEPPGEEEPADDKPTDSEPDPVIIDPEPVSVSALSVDTEHVYEGMSKAFRDGYIPTVSGGKVAIVLPLLPEGIIRDDVIECSLDLGQTSDSPFVYANYRKEVRLTNEEVDKDTFIPVFLVRFTLPLTSSRYNGIYPVTVTAKGKTDSGMEVVFSSTLYVTISDGRSRDAVPSASVPENKIESAPKIIVSRSATTPESVTAGTEFSVLITLLNTSETEDVKNMTATMNASSDEMTLLADSNVFYIPKLEHGSTYLLTLNYRCSRDTLEGKYSVNVDLSYENSDAVSYSSSGSAVFSIMQPVEMSLSASRFPDAVTAGETTYLTMQVLNLGRGSVYNVRCEVSGFGLLPSGVGYIGTMAGGSEGTTRVNVFVGAKTMTDGYEGEEMYGSTTGVIRLVYEDEDGNEYDQQETFTTVIQPPVINDRTDDQDPQEGEKDPAKRQWIITAAVLGVLIAGGVTAATIAARRKRK